MSWIQFEVWGLVEGREELIECVATLKQAESVAQEQLEFNEQVWIMEDKDDELKEVRRYRG